MRKKINIKNKFEFSMVINDFYENEHPKYLDYYMNHKSVLLSDLLEMEENCTIFLTEKFKKSFIKKWDLPASLYNKWIKSFVNEKLLEKDRFIPGIYYFRQARIDEIKNSQNI